MCPGSASPTDDAYKRAGVDIDAAESTLGRIAAAVRSTYTEGVLAGLGAFGGLFELPSDLGRPVLVASTDGVGTKTTVAAAVGDYSGVGGDLVNHCVNDILVQGATPLFFLDYVASARLDTDVTVAIVTGAADACRANGVALLGGETAEMPGVYVEGALDVAGTIVGVVERDRIIDGSAIREGDVLLGFASGGLQTNGFSLARQVVEGRYDEPLVGSTSVGDALLAPHRSFQRGVRPLLEAGLVRGMAHVTGGGLPGNLPRVLPAGLGAELRAGSWPEPAIFDHLRRRGGLDETSMRRAFNLGIGFVVVVAPSDAEAARATCPERLYTIGRVVSGAGVRWLA